jgi:hypothetical protein
LKSPEYAKFKGRFLAMAKDLAMPGGEAAAQELWLKVVTALQATDAGYKAAPSDAKSGRKDLAADGFKKIMAEFDPITAALKPYMEKYAHGKKSWGFWSGKPSVELAKKHAEVCLEKSALGSLFDNINISGGWDIQMWASLSKAYATHAAEHVGDAKFTGFVGLGSSAEQSIFNKIEQPQFVGMLSEKQKIDLKIDWYAGACNPENINQPDYRFKAGSLDGVYAKGDRAAMVDKAETENKRRIDLFKEKGINEGPGGAGDGVVAAKSLIETRPATMEAKGTLAADVAKATAGQVLFSNGADAKSATEKILQDHKDAHLDKASGALTLPPVTAPDSSKPLTEVAADLARQTGVSRVTVEKDEDGVALHGHINPNTPLTKKLAFKKRGDHVFAHALTKLPAELRGYVTQAELIASASKIDGAISHISSSVSHNAFTLTVNKPPIADNEGDPQSQAFGNALRLFRPGFESFLSKLALVDLAIAIGSSPVDEVGAATDALAALGAEWATLLNTAHDTECSALLDGAGRALEQQGVKILDDLKSSFPRSLATIIADSGKSLPSK